MKHFTFFKACFLLASIFISFNFIFAQTVILEQDGAANEFVVADWTIDAPAFATTSKVNISSGKQGTLSLSNANSYKNITVELHFSQPNAISFDINLGDGASGNLSKTGVISDATSTPNKAVVNFNNTTGFQLKSLKISNPSMGVGIIYLKITGTGSSASIDEQNKILFKVAVLPNHFKVNVEKETQLFVYNASGQLLDSFQLHVGENILPNALKGILFLTLRDKNGAIISRKKVMR